MTGTVPDILSPLPRYRAQVPQFGFPEPVSGVEYVDRGLLGRHLKRATYKEVRKAWLGRQCSSNQAPGGPAGPPELE